MGFPPTNPTIIQCPHPIGTLHKDSIPTTEWKGEHDSVRVRDFLFECYYEADVNDFRRLCVSKGALICAVLWVSRWNVYGQTNGAKCLIVYQHTEELEMEVLC
jgi:hypothetical protein